MTTNGRCVGDDVNWDCVRFWVMVLLRDFLSSISYYEKYDNLNKLKLTIKKLFQVMVYVAYKFYKKNSRLRVILSF